MKVQIAYGKGHLELDLPDFWDVDIVEPVFVPSVLDQDSDLRAAIRNPIGTSGLDEFVRADETVGIIINDISRATPTATIVRAILAEIPHVAKQNITLFNALGTHRSNTDQELRGMLGDDLVDTYRIVQNDCQNLETQVLVGKTARGNSVWINKELMAVDTKVLTGFIEPHFFAGFSGGGKAVMPGMAGLETILGNHSAENISDTRATWGITTGNPIWEEVREVVGMVGRTFLVNVALNRDKRITAVFAGDVKEAHAAGCAAVKQTAMASVEQSFDIVVTSNSGYPLDLNLYQAVKGMSAAAQVVRPGGAIIVAAECWDGIPEHGLFGRLVKEAPNAQTLLNTIKSPGYCKQDQWQAQILAQILLKAEVYVHNSTLSAEQLRDVLVQPADSLVNTLAMLVERHGSPARICILPEGPVTIPYIKSTI